MSYVVELCPEFSGQTNDDGAEEIFKKELPCYQCIVLAACKSKQYIFCTKLWTMIDSIFYDKKFKKDMGLDRMVKDFFPNCLEVSKEKSESPNCTYAWRK